MSKGFGKAPRKYPSNGLWFCSSNWEKGFFGTLDECLDKIEHCFLDSVENLAAGLLLMDLEEKLGSNHTGLEKLKTKIEQQEDQQIKSIRAKVRDTCLREGRIEKSDWDIRFQGRSAR